MGQGQGILWNETADGTPVITPKPGQSMRIIIPPTHYAAPSKETDNAIEIKPREEK